MFYERLRQLCEQNKSNITDVSVKVLGVSNATPTNWKKGVLPKASVVVDAAKYFHVSTDYLLGLSNDPSPAIDNARVLDNDEERLIDRLRAAPESVRVTAFRVADAVLSGEVERNAVSLAQNDRIIHHKNAQSPFTTGRKSVNGKAAAGSPITAVHEDDMHVTVPAKYLADRYFIVEAKGDSMIDANIESGDYCVFDSEAYQDNGSIVLAHVEGATEEEEVTIKRLYRRDGKIELRPANPDYPPMIYDDGCVRITGVLVRILPPEAIE